MRVDDDVPDGKDSEEAVSEAEEVVDAAQFISQGSPLVEDDYRLCEH